MIVPSSCEGCACRHEALQKDRNQLKEQLQAQLTKVTQLYQDKDELNTRYVVLPQT
jgi:hypothetical protein